MLNIRRFFIFKSKDKYYFRRGNRYNRHDKYAKAISAFRKATDLNPSFVEAYNNMGNAYNGLGDHLAALINFRQALRINPNYSTAYYNIGLTCIMLGDYLSAIEAFEEALNIDPYDHSSRQKLDALRKRVKEQDNENR